ncbi:hypothetical protein KJ652_00585 [Patescibacteria group bacterium]|nr:hypothetical protein [Patescibacteria group bacterium]
MAVVEMQKVAIIAHESIKESLIDTLYKEGVMELSEAESKNIEIDHTEVNYRAAELKFAIDVLKNHASKETLAVAGKSVPENDIIFAAKHTDVRGIVDQLHKLEERDTDAERTGKEAEALSKALSPWMNLKHSLADSNESELAVRILGLIPSLKLKSLRDKIDAENLRTEISEVNVTAKETYCVAHILKEDQKRFEELAVSEGWTNVELPRADGTPTELYEQALMHIKESERIRTKSDEERSRLSVELPNLTKVAIFMKWLSDRQSAREAMSPTETTVTLLGWVPKKKLGTLEQKLQSIGPAVTILKVKPDENEDAPVLLWNPTAVTPFESVTNLYGYPLYKEFDPTLSLAPFFALYFALCLTDAGYGFVLALVFGIAILKKKLKIRESKLAWTLFLGGLVTIVVSIPFGGYFGLAPEQVPAFLTKTTAEGGMLFKGQIWNLNEQSGINFLQNLSLILGLTHLFYGMFLAGYYKWIHGKKAEAFWMDFTSHILMGSILFMVFAPDVLTEISKYIFYAAILLMVWGKGYGSKIIIRPLMGLIGMLNFTIGMLSNTLSYLRILALGLVTGAIAMAVNQVAIEVGKLLPVFLAIPAIIIIAFMGHLISIALNTLGSFIHSGRLQFIEFFSQFFEGGGKAFTPFKRSTN